MDAVRIHRLERLVQEEELRRASDRPDERLRERQSESERQPFVGSPGQFVRLQEVALLAGEEAQSEVGSDLQIGVAPSGDARQQSTHATPQARPGAMPDRIAGLVEELDQEHAGVDLLANLVALLAELLVLLLERGPATVLLLVLPDFGVGTVALAALALPRVGGLLPLLLELLAERTETLHQTVHVVGSTLDRGGDRLGVPLDLGGALLVRGDRLLELRSTHLVERGTGRGETHLRPRHVVELLANAARLLLLFPQTPEFGVRLGPRPRLPGGAHPEDDRQEEGEPRSAAERRAQHHGVLVNSSEEVDHPLLLRKERPTGEEGEEEHEERGPPRSPPRSRRGLSLRPRFVLTDRDRSIAVAAEEGVERLEFGLTRIGEFGEARLERGQRAHPVAHDRELLVRAFVAGVVRLRQAPGDLAERCVRRGSRGGLPDLLADRLEGLGAAHDPVDLLVGGLLLRLELGDPRLVALLGLFDLGDLGDVRHVLVDLQLVALHVRGDLPEMLLELRLLASDLDLHLLENVRADDAVEEVRHLIRRSRGIALRQEEGAREVLEGEVKESLECFLNLHQTGGDLLGGIDPEEACEVGAVAIDLAPNAVASRTGDRLSLRRAHLELELDARVILIPRDQIENAPVRGADRLSEEGELDQFTDRRLAALVRSLDADEAPLRDPLQGDLLELHEVLASKPEQDHASASPSPSSSPSLRRIFASPSSNAR